jgi:hypothetical protein
LNLDTVQGVWARGLLVEGTACSSGNVYCGQFQDYKPHGHGIMLFRPKCPPPPPPPPLPPPTLSSRMQIPTNRRAAQTQAQAQPKGLVADIKKAHASDKDDDSDESSISSSISGSSDDDSTMQMQKQQLHDALSASRGASGKRPKAMQKKAQKRRNGAEAVQRVAYEADIYEGQWRQGKMHGHGRYTFGNALPSSSSSSAGSRPLARALAAATAALSSRNIAALPNALATAARAAAAIATAAVGPAPPAGTHARPHTFAQSASHCTYVGGFQDNLQHGQGKILYPNGSSVCGVFCEGEAPARGTYVSHSSSVIRAAAAAEAAAAAANALSSASAHRDGDGEGVGGGFFAARGAPRRRERGQPGSAPVRVRGRPAGGGDGVRSTGRRRSRSRQWRE